MKGQAHVKYQAAFIAGLKGGIVEGVSKTVSMVLLLKLIGLINL